MTTTVSLVYLCGWIAAREGFRERPYPDPGDRSLRIGYGRTATSHTEHTNRLTEDRWLRQRAEKARHACRRRLPELDTFSSPLQAALVGEEYRGMLPLSPKTTKLIRQRDFKLAAEEYGHCHDVARNRILEVQELLRKEEEERHDAAR